MYPDDFELGNDCLTCWAAGETPKYIYANFANIKKGYDWLPWLPEPPNGLFQLEQLTPCLWQLSFGIFAIEFSISAGNSITKISSPATIPEDIFENSRAACAWFFENDNNWPAGVDFYGGFCQVFFRTLSNSPSLQKHCNLLNIKNDENTFADFFPVDADNTVVRIASIPESINIKIKREQP